MSHKHFCHVTSHWFECTGKVLRRGDTKPSTCFCDTCGLPLEEGDHSQCQTLVELVSCLEHRMRIGAVSWLPKSSKLPQAKRPLTQS